LGEFSEDSKDDTEKDLKQGFGQVTLHDENKCNIEYKWLILSH
jgi:hypothetical protein